MININKKYINCLFFSFILIYSISAKDLNLDLDYIQQQIQLESNLIIVLNKKVEITTEKIWELQQEKRTQEDSLELLDKEINLLTKKINQYQKIEQIWQQRLSKLKHNKSFLRAEIRSEETIYQKLRQKQLIQSELILDNNTEKTNIMIFEWLLSGKTIAESSEQQYKEQFYRNRIKNVLIKSYETKILLEKHEKSSIELVKNITKLKNQMEKDYNNLKILADGHAKMLEQIQQNTQEKKIFLTKSQEELLESQLVLKSLQAQLDDIDPTVELSKLDQNQNFLQFPLKLTPKITAKFKNEIYLKQFGRIHFGIDFYAPQSSPIYAPAYSRVFKVSNNGYGYSYFILEHSNGFYITFGHVSNIMVKEDQWVQKGDLIGETGGTPGTLGAGYFSNGPHLHFEVFKNGTFLDPLLYLQF